VHFETHLSLPLVWQRRLLGEGTVRRRQDYPDDPAQEGRTSIRDSHARVAHRARRLVAAAGLVMLASWTYETTYTSEYGGDLDLLLLGGSSAHEVREKSYLIVYFNQRDIVTNFVSKRAGASEALNGSKPKLE
jgi:hypothetical protein